MNLQSLSAVANHPQFLLPANPAAAPDAGQEQRRDDGSGGFDPRLCEGEATAAAAFALRAEFDCRVSGPSIGVRRFDRMALVVEGFEHLREILDGQTQQAEEDFGVGNVASADDTGDATTMYGSLDLRA